MSFSDLFDSLPPIPDPAKTGARSPRCENRAAAWKRDIGRAAGYLLTQSPSDDDREAVERAYEQALAAGPDFTRYREKSTFREAPKLGIDRNAYARILHALDCIERGTYRRGRKKGKQGIPRTAARVLKALLALAMRYGRVCPSLEGLARIACVCKQTVVSCLKTLRLYGFVIIHRRIKRIATPLGQKVVQDCNAYTIQEPKGLGALALAVYGRRSESKKLAASSRDGAETNAQEKVELKERLSEWRGGETTPFTASAAPAGIVERVNVSISATLAAQLRARPLSKA